MPTVVEKTQTMEPTAVLPAVVSPVSPPIYSNGWQRRARNNEDDRYPDGDGKPMADNTLQYQWIVLFTENLKTMYADRDDVFVAGDLLWYPVRVPRPMRPPSAAPDTMVVFGRPPGYRGSYKQWEENDVAPQVAFEVLSPNNSPSEIATKGIFYELYGVQEYYIYDPDRNIFEAMIRKGEGDHLETVATMPTFISPLLGIQFDSSGEELIVYRPDGERFKTSVEIRNERSVALQRADAEQQRADAEQQRADAEQKRADAEQQRADGERQRADGERQRAERLLAQLRAAGIEPEA